ncbi:MAG: hypothetical protein SPL80_04630 [Bacilli bacterium]|nr:hypothetical protein [Bacilli bacterium]
MFIISLVVILALAIVLPWSLPEYAFTPEYLPAQEVFSQKLNEFFTIDGFYFVLFIGLASLCLLLISVTNKKTVLAMACAGNVGVIAYFVLEFIKIFEAFQKGMEAANGIYNVAFSVTFSFSTVAVIIVASMYTLWSIVSVIFAVIRVFKAEASEKRNVEIND